MLWLLHELVTQACRFGFIAQGRAHIQAHRTRIHIHNHHNIGLLLLIYHELKVGHLNELILKRSMLSRERDVGERLYA